jgi:hypothetical protein
MAAAPRHREALLTEKLNQPGWELLDSRTLLERTLAKALLANFDRFYDVIAMIAGRFGWVEDGDAKSPDPVVNELIARQGARAWRMEIERVTGRGANRMRDAMTLLRGGINLTSFERFGSKKKNLADMHALLKEMHADYPAALRFETNSDSVRWWVARFESAPQTRAPAPAKKSQGIWPFLVFFLLIGPALRLLTHEKEGSNFQYQRTVESVTDRVSEPPAYVPRQQRLTFGTPALDTTPVPDRFKGYWNGTTAYRLGDSVTFNGYRWTARMNTQGDVPGVSDLWFRQSGLPQTDPLMGR